jgi:hypothetical protein
MSDPLTNEDGTAYHSDEWWAGYAAAIPEGAVLVTEEDRDRLLGELSESPLPGARYAWAVVSRFLRHLREGTE